MKQMHTKVMPLVLAAIVVLTAPVVAIRAADSALEIAWQDVDYLDYRRAAPQFQKIRKSADKNTDRWRQATLGLALCLHQRQPDTKADKDTARELYDELIQASNDHDIQATALLLRGKLDQLIDYFGDKEDFSSAARHYERILKQWPHSRCADQAALHLAQTAVFSMDKASTSNAVEKLGKWVNSNPANHYAATQWLLLSLAYRVPLDNPSAAVDTSILAVDAGLPKEMAVDTLYWRIASLAESIGKTDIARDFYTRIISEIQRSRYTYSAQQQIKGMGFTPPELIDPFETE
jgi:tetratricopeptide (TPR) repeat protein